MIESRKRAVSIRMNAGDLRKVKKLAARLGVRDSDIIRFAIKGMLSRLGPLHDSEVSGCNLVPVFVESGVELLRFFDLDAAQLEAIINDGAEPARRVARDDVALLALAGVREPYAALKLSQLGAQEAGSQEMTEPSSSLRQYLYEKYVYRSADEHQSADATRLTAVAGGRHD